MVPHKINLEVANHLLYVAQLMKRANEVHFKIQPFIRNAKAVKDCEFDLTKVSDHFLLSWQGLGPAVLREIREYMTSGKQTTKVQKYFQLMDPSYKPFAEVFDVADTLKNVLDEEFLGQYRVDICGSLRRNAPFCRDIDIITTAPASEVYRIFDDCEFEVKYGADKRIRFEAFGFGVDVRMTTADKYQFMLLHYTGSATHNIMLRSVAIKHGWALNEYGLWSASDHTVSVLDSPNSERDIFNKLGVMYACPEER